MMNSLLFSNVTTSAGTDAEDTKQECEDMTDFKEIDIYDIFSPNTKNEGDQDLMWSSLLKRYSRDTIDAGYDFYPKDDADELSRYSISSTEERNLGDIAHPPKDITVEYSISDSLMKLSINARSAVEEEVHGIVSITQETPELLSSCLHKFDKELTVIKNSALRLKRLERNGDQDVLRNVIRTTSDEMNYPVEAVNTSAFAMGSYTPMHFSCAPSSNIIRDESKMSCYVNNRDIRLRFLRAERYDAKKAAWRFVNFLAFAQELFGDFVADRAIQLSDLKTREEKNALSNVSFQFLPFRDRSGRRVFVSVGTCGYEIAPKARIKVLLYMFWIASEDTESQRKGVVIIGWPSGAVHQNSIIQSNDEMSESDGDGSTGSEKNIWEENIRPKLVNQEGVYQVKCLDGLPLRIAALHICFEDRPIYKILNRLFHFTMNSYLKARYKVHIGEPQEIRYMLQGFGIPTDFLPLTHTMTIKRQSHLQWIAFRKIIENNQGGNSRKPLPINPNDLVECPRSYDVIMGKSRYKNSPGNVFYMSLIEKTHEKHAVSPKGHKVKLTWWIVEQMEDQDRRFLELNKSVKAWVHIKDRDVMRQKVAQSFKEYKRNAAVIRSKKNLLKHDSNSQDLSIKRQKTAIVPLFTKTDCFPGCLSGFNYDENDISRARFTSM